MDAVIFCFLIACRQRRPSCIGWELFSFLGLVRVSPTQILYSIYSIEDLYIKKSRSKKFHNSTEMGWTLRQKQRKFDWIWERVLGLCEDLFFNSFILPWWCRDNRINWYLCLEFVRPSNTGFGVQKTLSLFWKPKGGKKKKKILGICEE